MKISTTLWVALVLMSGLALAAQPLLAQSNPPCAGMSSTAFANWPQFHSDSCHTGYNPNEFIIGPSNVANLTVAWTYQTGQSIESIPAVANGILYVGSDDHYLYALNATTGTLVWKYPMNGTGYVWGQPAVVNGVVYMIFSNVLYALNANNGTLLWTYSGPGNSGVSNPTVVNGVVYVGAGDGLNALNANTGTLVWKYASGGGTPAVVDGVAYVECGSDGQTCALNANTGALLWISDKYYFGNLPVVSNGIVYLASSDSRNGPGVSALRAGDGSFLWHFRTKADLKLLTT